MSIIINEAKQADKTTRLLYNPTCSWNAFQVEVESSNAEISRSERVPLGKAVSAWNIQVGEPASKLSPAGVSKKIQLLMRVQSRPGAH